jgi:hypothetical protein
MRFTCIVMWFALLAWSRTAGADGKKLVVVVAKGSELRSISRVKLKHCFLSNGVSDGAKTLVPFNASIGAPERSAFDRAVLGMSPDDVGRFWVNRKVRGQSAAPRSLPSNALMAKIVARFPAAIGYLPVDQLTPEVQPVAVDGVPYTDPRYDLAAP